MGVTTMYNNIAGKIKLLAKIGFIVETIAIVIAGIGILLMDDEVINILTGVLVMVMAPFAAWASSWVLYGFGELIENTAKLVSNNKTNSPTSNNDLPEL